jgi:hypothetical protein
MESHSSLSTSLLATWIDVSQMLSCMYLQYPTDVYPLGPSGEKRTFILNIKNIVTLNFIKKSFGT